MDILPCVFLREPRRDSECFTAGCAAARFDAKDHPAFVSCQQGAYVFMHAAVMNTKGCGSSVRS
jgi:hypothetical protein